MIALVASGLLAVVLSGCVAARTPNLQNIYNEGAQQHGPGHNPVIVIPGTMGSKLVDAHTGDMVWGAFTGTIAHPHDPAAMRAMTLPMERGRALSDLHDQVRPDGALDRVRLQIWPGFSFEPPAYLQLLLTLGAAGYADQTLGEAGAIDYGKDHYTCFQFDYDWRRSNAENAARLDAFIEQKRNYVETENRRRFGSSERVRFDIVAHSMGSLVARYYLRYGAQPLPASGLPVLNWAGAENVEKLILVAPPNAGSILALERLTRGFVLVPWLGRYQPAVLGTMPAAYELLPRSRHGVLLDPETGAVLDIFDPDLWERRQWGLANPDQDRFLATLLPTVASSAERRAIALDHLEKCLDNARRFHAALDIPATPPPWVRLSLFAGDAMDMGVVAVAQPKFIKITQTGPGDGTVARYSALMDERTGQPGAPGKLQSPVAWQDVIFLFHNHLGVTRSATFADNVLFQLIERP